MRRLVLVRHGESWWNAQRRIQGQSCAGLSDVGHLQAQAVASALAATYPGAEVVCSDLQRTVETATPLVATLGRDLRLDQRVRERSFGAWEGRTPDELATEDPDRWHRWRAGRDVIGEVGGETRDELADRVVPVMIELLDATPLDGTTIVVTHGGPVWHGTHRLLGLTPGTLGSIANASVTELVRAAPATDGTRSTPMVLDRWNDVGHLPVELRTTWRPRVAADSARVVGP